MEPLTALNTDDHSMTSQEKCPARIMSLSNTLEILRTFSFPTIRPYLIVQLYICSAQAVWVSMCKLTDKAQRLWLLSHSQYFTLWCENAHTAGGERERGKGGRQCNAGVVCQT